jgi:hypothetical protein
MKRLRAHLWDLTRASKLVSCTRGFSEQGLGGVDGITLSEDIERWRAVVNTTMNFGVP